MRKKLFKKPERKKETAGHKPGTLTSMLWNIESINDLNFETGMKFVKACVKWLETHEGLFRKAGSEERLSVLQKEAAHAKEFFFPEDEEVHNISTLLKRYFRSMKVPLLPYSLYDLWIAIDEVEKDEEREENIKKILVLVPDKEKEILKEVIKYLNFVSQHAEANKMTPTNLAIVFAPNILRPAKEDPLTLISDAGHAANSIACLISNFASCFGIKESTGSTTKPVTFSPEDISVLRDRYSCHRQATKLEIRRLCENIPQEVVEERQKIVANSIKNGIMASIQGVDTIFVRAGAGLKIDNNPIPSCCTNASSTETATTDSPNTNLLRARFASRKQETMGAALFGALLEHTKEIAESVESEHHFQYLPDSEEEIDSNDEDDEKEYDDDDDDDDDDDERDNNNSNAQSADSTDYDKGNNDNIKNINNDTNDIDQNDNAYKAEEKPHEGYHVAPNALLPASMPPSSPPPIPPQFSAPPGRPVPPPPQSLADSGVKNENLRPKRAALPTSLQRGQKNDNK